MPLEFSITTDLAGQKSELSVFLDVIAGSGFQTIHWCYDWTGEPVFYGTEFTAAVRRTVDSCGVRIADVHSYDGPWPEKNVDAVLRQRLELDLNRIAFAAGVGAEVVVLHLCPHPDDSDEDFYRHCAEKLAVLLPAAREAGVRLAAENLVLKWHTDEFFGRLLDAFRDDGLGFCYDSGHAILNHQEHLLERHIGDLLATHLHDNDGQSDQHLPPGRGRADWPAILGTIAASDYGGTLNLELKLPDGETPDTFCRLAFRTLSDLWARHGGTDR